VILKNLYISYTYRISELDYWNIGAATSTVYAIDLTMYATELAEHAIKIS